jgi:starch phosphorylase
MIWVDVFADPRSYLDSLATLDYAAWGYGIRYEYGIFKQKIIDGYQVEVPDYWLAYGNPFEIERTDVTYDVRFRGWVRKEDDKHYWEGGERVLAVAYDVPIPGYHTKNCINIRLWGAKPQKEFDFSSFNEGNYDRAVEEQKSAENISAGGFQHWPYDPRSLSHINQFLFSFPR